MEIFLVLGSPLLGGVLLAPHHVRVPRMLVVQGRELHERHLGQLSLPIQDGVQVFLVLQVFFLGLGPVGVILEINERLMMGG